MRTTFTLAILATAINVSPLSAQEHTDSLILDSRLFHRSDLYVLGGFAASAITLLQYDRKLAEWFQSDRLANSRTLDRTAAALDIIGGVGAVAVGGVMYVTGRVAGKPRLAHLALHTGEAVLVGLGTAGVIKGAVGRARPYVTGDTNPRDFEFLRGFKGSPWQSFPSGHSTVSFAVAAAMTSETSAWWPSRRWVIGPVLFGAATLVGASRMYDDKHWASDVVMGAAIGTFAGLKTVRFNHTRTGNRIDRWLLGDDADLRVSPGPDGSLQIGVAARW
ncbi:MAG TPA: phosphatase PAP2 family protein [Gemmatimonadaceae bacterium]|nr:phosphatase PAP2 family protein [Gemmatimonadaceae bacterium]